MTDKYLNRYRIATARAVWHDYGVGNYFVTICTAAMQHRFGTIVDGAISLTALGRCAEENIQNVSTHYPYAQIPLFVVMPNHIHLIVCINENATDSVGCFTDAINRISTCETEQSCGCKDVIHRVCTGNNKTPGGITAHKNPMLSHCLGAIIRGIKARITHYANCHEIPFEWQSRFHEHIIRNQDEMNLIAQYIESNVAQWDNDRFNIPLPSPPQQNPLKGHREC